MYSTADELARKVIGRVTRRFAGRAAKARFEANNEISYVQVCICASDVSPFKINDSVDPKIK